MITFILNNQLVSSENATGSSLVDFIRYDINLHGTKVGCREGDCGACTVLEGTLKNGVVIYRSIVSCLIPLINVHGKHIVSIEGINHENLTPVQEAIVDHSATQCGFCTPGFVMSFTAHALSDEPSTREKAIASVSGNICRCTGYKSIEKAADAISNLLKDKKTDDPIGWLVKNRFLPGYFLSIPKRLSEIEKHIVRSSANYIVVSGGTDLLVQKAEELNDSNIKSFASREDLRGIKVENGKCIIGAATTTSEIEESSIIKDHLPEISKYMKLVASKPVRNMGTVGGNIVNASPIGDLTILLLALNADLILEGPAGKSTVPLKDFFIGYKKLKINKEEFLKSIIFSLPQKYASFNFEKVSKRTHLDIASVNTAIQIISEDNRIKECYLSAGGVSPIPLFLTKTCIFLKGKIISNDIILQANEIMQEEISPISDVRGSKEYKRLLLRQLFFAHFVRLFPGALNLKYLMNIK
jgi:xanthine dehydrogenase small subunit